jgi:hypothetical protein
MKINLVNTNEKKDCTLLGKKSYYQEDPFTTVLSNPLLSTSPLYPHLSTHSQSHTLGHTRSFIHLYTSHSHSLSFSLTSILIITSTLLVT